MAGASSTFEASDISVGDNGRVAFSTQDPFIAADTGFNSDVYVRSIPGNTTTLVSRSLTYGSGNASSFSAVISGDGLRVAFASNATDLDPADTNLYRDIYTTSSGGGPPHLESKLGNGPTIANGNSYSPSISYTGRWLAFETAAQNLVAGGDVNGNAGDVIRRDTQTGINAFASIKPEGGQFTTHTQSARISGDGAKVAFELPASTDVVYVRDILGATTVIANRSNGPAGVIGEAAVGGLSDDGTLVVLSGELDPTNFNRQVYLRTLSTATTTLASASNGADTIGDQLGGSYMAGQHPMSGDGRYVLFIFGGSGIVPGVSGFHLYRRDLQTGAVVWVDQDGQTDWGSLDGGVFTLSGDGQRGGVLGRRLRGHRPASGDPRYRRWSHDRYSGSARRYDGQRGRLDARAQPRRSPGGGTHRRTALADGHQRDRRRVRLESLERPGCLGERGEQRVHRDRTTSTTLTISSDGAKVGFTATGVGLAPGNDTNSTQAYVRDLHLSTTTLVSRANGSDGVGGDGDSGLAAMSDDGNRVSFETQSSNLGDGDDNKSPDVHVRDLVAGTTTWISRASTGGAGDGASYGGSPSADGQRAAFHSDATNIVPGDTNGRTDLFVRDLPTGQITRLGLHADGAQSTSDGFTVSLSGNGHCAVFNTQDAATVSGGYASFEYTHVYVRALDAACPQGAADPGPGPATPTADQTAPAFTALTLSRKAFSTKGKKKGTTLGFKLSEAATVKLAIAKVSPGKLKAAKCVAPKKAKKKAKKCERLGAAKTLRTVKASAGKSTTKFDGKLGKKKLAKGTYRFVLTATDAAGNVGRASVLFKVK